MSPSVWQVIRAQGGVSIEKGLAALSPGGPTAHWRVRNELGEILAMPDEAAAIAHFSYACRQAVVRSRQQTAAV